MHYIAETNAFYTFLETHPLPPSAICLWHALMHIANRAFWPAEIAVPLSVLQMKTGLGKDALLSARNRLAQAGRIRWHSRRDRQSAVYEILCLAPALPPQPAAQPPAKPAAPVPAINKQDTTNTTALSPAVRRAFQEGDFGSLTAKTRARLCALEEEFGADWLAEALARAARRGRAHLGYAEGILIAWRQAGAMDEERPPGQREKLLDGNRYLQRDDDLEGCYFDFSED
jgi:DnaD/phage-associated family protein